jgi:hypothetical protein
MDHHLSCIKITFTLFIFLKFITMHFIYMVLLIFSIKTVYGSINGGWYCLTCTVIISHIEQLAIIKDQTLEESLEKFCELIPEGLFRKSCENIVKIYGKYILNGYYKNSPVFNL